MDITQNKTVDEYNIWKFKGYDELIDAWPLMTTPYPVLLIFTAYLLFVLKVGPDYMKKRPPYNLNTVLLMYNVLQVALSVFVFLVGCRILSKIGIVSSLCDLDKNNIQQLAVGMYYYVGAKVSELLDTVFFVLRKKYNQVTFLHVYHHALMLLISWYTLKYEPTYSIVFLGTLNTFVHIVMYSYYALSTFPSLAKYLWWKKYITTMQLIQFGLIILQVTANTYITGCPPSYFLLSMIFINTALMIYLFSDFYFKSYSNDNKKEKLNNVQKIEKSDSRSNFANSVTNHSIHEKIH